MLKVAAFVSLAFFCKKEACWIKLHAGFEPTESGKHHLSHNSIFISFSLWNSSHDFNLPQNESHDDDEDV